jgi:hypothetical protein
MHAWMRRRAACALAVVAAALVPGPAVAGDDGLSSLVRATATIVRERYVDADAAESAATRIERHAADGLYDGLAPKGVARAIARDLREATGDLHFGLTVDAVQYAYLRDHDTTTSPTAPEERLRRAVVTNFGFTEVRILPGNVGYLKLDSCSCEPGAVEKANAVMAFLGDADAVIIDLRDNGGGWSTMERLMCSYFVPHDPDTPLVVFTTRHTGEHRQVWTHDWLPEDRIDDVPLYVLTSAKTFSAAEGVAYQLSARGRAKVIGERSSGGANGVEFVPLVADYVLKIPTTSGIVPVTGDDWEGVGVAPDVECAVAEALDRAHLLAIDARLERCADRDRPALRLVRDRLAAAFQTVGVDPATWRRFVGVYAGQTVRFRDDALWFIASGEDRWRRMTPIDPRTFLVEGRDDFKVAFEEVDGRMTARVHLADGRTMRFLQSPLPADGET